ncbi:MAG: ABC transporter ATP-binding protein [Coriobacteriales bacterium]|nr:ABC transporter ATP-binding protein [Coriobacteriales bacterium]
MDASLQTPALEARNLVLSWDGGETIVARDISLTVNESETVCLVGKSGCGKTTILHALAGLTRPLSGAVVLEGQDVTGTPGHISYMLQKDLLIPSKKVIDNAALPLVLTGVPKKEARERAGILFERFGLAGTENSWPYQLSGGMRQRVAFLRTYLMGNKVVLLDEPFSALDALTRHDLRNWYKSMAQQLGLASLMITHDVDEAVAMSSRIYILRGNPGAGVPSTITAEIEVPQQEAGAEKDFELSYEFIDCKRRVTELLM